MPSCFFTACGSKRVVIHHLVIHLFAQRRPGYPASHSAKQPPEKSTSITANSDAYWPADHSKHRTNFSARQGSGGTTGRTACGTNQTTCLLTDFFRDDASRVTAWARAIHTQILSSDECAEPKAGTRNTYRSWCGERSQR